MRILLPFLVLLALASTVGADHCTTWSTSQPPVNLFGLYIDDNPCQPNECYPWVYLESNGLAGLQRADNDHDDTCHGMIEPDTLIL